MTTDYKNDSMYALTRVLKQLNEIPAALNDIRELITPPHSKDVFRVAYIAHNYGAYAIGSLDEFMGHLKRDHLKLSQIVHIWDLLEGHPNGKRELEKLSVKRGRSEEEAAAITTEYVIGMHNANAIRMLTLYEEGKIGIEDVIGYHDRRLIGLGEHSHRPISI